MSGFDVQTTKHFDRTMKKLARAHTELREESRRSCQFSRTIAYNRTRRDPIKKLTGVGPGEGQYRIRMSRFRFLYDIDKQTVFLKACALRREDTY